jgi:GTP-binding protein
VGLKCLATKSSTIAVVVMARYHHHLVVWYRRLAMSHQRFSSFSTSAAAVVQPTAVVAIKSRRQAFKQLQVHPSIRISIENLGIGIPPRKQRTRSFLPSSSRATEYNRPIAPRPFGTKPRLVRHVGKADELITTAASAAAGSSTSTSTTATTTTTPPRIPPPLLTLPEVAIAGRSNVGKSTLLNALLFYDAHRLKKGKHKAIVSKRPGETIQIAIYELEKRLRIVDLPGYGFAYGKKQYQELVVNYLALRGTNILKRVLLLIDARHGLKTTDIEFLELLQQSSPYKTVPPLQLVLTKCDAVKQADLARRVAQVQQQLSDALRREPSKSFPVLLVSVNPPRQVAGVYELQKTIAMLAKKKKKSTNDVDDDIDAAETVETASRANTTTTTTTATGSAKLATTNNTNTINNSYNNNVQTNSRQPTSKHDHQNRFHRKFRSRSTTTTTVNDAAPTFTNSKSSNRVDYSSGGTSSRPRTTILRETGRRSRSNNDGETVRTTTGTRSKSTNRVDDSSGGSSRPRTTTTIRDTGRRSRSNNHGETVRTTTSTGTRNRSTNRVDYSSGGSSRPRTTTTLRDTGRRSRSNNRGETVRTTTSTSTRNRSTNRVDYSSGGTRRPRTTTTIRDTARRSRSHNHGETARKTSTGTRNKAPPPLRTPKRSSGSKFNDSKRNNNDNSSGRPSVPKSRPSSDKQTWNNKTSRQSATRKPFAGRSNNATVSSYGKTTQTRATGPTRKSSPQRRRSKQ